MSTATATVIDTADVTALAVAADAITPVVTGRSSGGAFELFTLVGPADSGPPPHSHDWQEVMLVLSGEIDVMVGDSTCRLAAGAAVHVPENVTHSYRIATPEARAVVVTSTGHASAFFADMDAEVTSPEDLGTMITVAKRHGLSSPLF